MTCQTAAHVSGHTWSLVTLPTPPALHPPVLLLGSGSPCSSRLSCWDWLRAAHPAWCQVAVPMPHPCTLPGSDKPAVLRAGSSGHTAQSPPTLPPLLSVEQVAWTQPCELTDGHHSQGEVLNVTKLYLKVAERVNFINVSFTTYTHTHTQAQKTHLQEPHKATAEGCWGAAGGQDSHKPCP